MMVTIIVPNVMSFLTDGGECNFVHVSGDGNGDSNGEEDEDDDKIEYDFFQDGEDEDE
jgi:hypothetical protein